MKVFKTYKYKLKLTKTQEKRVDSWIGACRYVYNLALETKIEAYKKGVSLSQYDLQNQLPALKEVDWIKDVNALTLQDVIARLNKAYLSFFKGGGFPKWAKKGEYASITFPRSIIIKPNGFSLEKLGYVKIFKCRMPDGKIKTATLKKENKGYFLCVSFESESKKIYHTCENQAVGIDMGLVKFLTDSNGIVIDNPKHTKKYEAKLRVKQRSLSRKKKGSRARLKVKSELSNLHRKISDSRNDFTNKISLQYIKENSLIAVEDLKVKNMVKFGNLSKHISDVSWSTFFDKLKYKSEFYEKTFIKIDPKFTSQKCSSCNHISKENRLTQSKFLCVECGHQMNADLNASINILGLGKAFVRQREAIACA